MSPYDIHQKEKYEQREYLIAVEQIKMMQEKLKVCYLRSGPNHFEDCKELREKLWTKMNTHNYGAPGPARSVCACLISRARALFQGSSSLFLISCWLTPTQFLVALCRAPSSVCPILWARAMCDPSPSRCCRLGFIIMRTD